MSNPFDELKPQEKTITVEGLDGEITIRELTLDEVNKISKQKDSADAMYSYVSLALINPKMGVKELKALGTRATPVLSDIISHVTPKSGNSQAS